MLTIKDLVEELDRESQDTRRALARVPEDRLTWRPHERSDTLGQLAMHIATIPAAIVEISQLAAFDMTLARQTERPTAGRVAEVLEAFDASIARAKDELSRMDDSALAEPWTMVNGDAEVLTIPRGTLFRTILLNHWYHHRGQLTVYLRLAGAAVPAIYGDSADERAFEG